MNKSLRVLTVMLLVSCVTAVRAEDAASASQGRFESVKSIFRDAWSTTRTTASQFGHDVRDKAIEVKDSVSTKTSDAWNSTKTFVTTDAPAWAKEHPVKTVGIAIVATIVVGYIVSKIFSRPAKKNKKYSHRYA